MIDEVIILFLSFPFLFFFLGHAVSCGLTSCLLASRPSKLTKQLICNRKSMKTAKPANREKVLTAGMLDRAPAEDRVNNFISM